MGSVGSDSPKLLMRLHPLSEMKSVEREPGFDLQRPSALPESTLDFITLADSGPPKQLIRECWRKRSG